MTDRELEHAEAAHAAETTNEHGFLLPKHDKASYLAGFEAGLDYMTDDNNAMEDVARKLLNERDAERARLAKIVKDARRIITKLASQVERLLLWTDDAQSKLDRAINEASK